MAYSNFVPSVWAAGIDTELERLCVFVEDCNTKYEGKVSKQGESVTILGVGRPTITTITKTKKDGLDIGAAEEVPTTSTVMYINQLSWFNYGVDDIDAAQASEDIMGALERETSEAIANEIDKHVAAQVVDAPKLFPAAIKVVSGEASAATEMNVLDILDKGIEKLRENDVSDATTIVVTVTPRFYTLFKKAYVKADTNNSEELKNGKVGMYGRVVVKCSNNVYKTASGAEDNIMIRTQRAVAFAKPLTKVEAYRPEKGFKDAVKGFALYQAQVVRPKEIFNVNVKYA